MNCSFFPCRAAFRTRSKAWITRARLYVRCVLCRSAFPLVPALAPPTPPPVARLCSSASSLLCRSQTSLDRASAASAPHLPATDHPAITAAMADPEISRFPRKERPCMPGSKTTPGLAGARNDAPASVAFRGVNNVGTRVYNAFAAQWLAYTLPYRRFAVILAEDCARIGGDVGCYSFIAVDSHHELLAGLSPLAPKNAGVYGTSGSLLQGSKRTRSPQYTYRIMLPADRRRPASARLLRVGCHPEV